MSDSFEQHVSSEQHVSFEQHVIEKHAISPIGECPPARGAGAPRASSPRTVRGLVACVIAVLAVVASSSPVIGVDEAVTMRVAARRLDGDRVEVAVQQLLDDTWGSRLLPTRRVVPADATAGHWLASSPLTLDGATVRVAARRLDGDRVEVAVQQLLDDTWGSRLLPTRRVVPADATAGHWLASSPLTLTPTATDHPPGESTDPADASENGQPQEPTTQPDESTDPADASENGQPQEPTTQPDESTDPADSSENGQPQEPTTQPDESTDPADSSENGQPQQPATTTTTPPTTAAPPPTTTTTAPPLPEELPGKPAAVFVRTIPDGFAALWWHPPDDGGPVDDYIVEIREADSTTWISVGDVSSDANFGFAGLEQLTKDTEYRVRVAAVNRTGTGPWATIQFRSLAY